jgi:hypothetical protein
VLRLRGPSSFILGSSGHTIRVAGHWLTVVSTKQPMS